MFQCIDIGYKPELLLSIDRPTALVPHVLVVCSEPQLFQTFILKAASRRRIDRGRYSQLRDLRLDGGVFVLQTASSLPR